MEYGIDYALSSFLKEAINKMLVDRQPMVFKLTECAGVVLMWEKSCVTGRKNKWLRGDYELYMSLRWIDSEEFIEDWSCVGCADDERYALFDMPLHSDDDLADMAKWVIESYESEYEPYLLY